MEDKRSYCLWAVLSPSEAALACSQAFLLGPEGSLESAGCLRFNSGGWLGCLEFRTTE